MKQKIMPLITIFIMLCVFIILVRSCRQDRLNEIDVINKNPKYIKALIIGRRSFKGSFVKVRYKVNGKIYIETDGFGPDDNVIEGDSITIKYSVTDPSLMITEFNEQF